MKRSGALVNYASSEDEEHAELVTGPVEQPAAKKRKLPALPSNLAVSTPVDNPALHQGRVRSSPHIEGQFAAYVYVPLKVPHGSALSTLLNDAFRRARNFVPILHSIGDTDMETDERELHISLTRPIYLRAHQREEFRAAVRAVSRQHIRFWASFANFAELTNDERTRIFLTVEVGAGHKELEALCKALAPTLRKYRQKEFYDKPRFHASIAWALLAESVAPQKLPQLPEDDGADDSAHPLEQTHAVSDSAGSRTPTRQLAVTSAGFPAILGFPALSLPTLESEFGAALRSRHGSVFEAEHVCVKIGKDVYRFRLQGES